MADKITNIYELDSKAGLIIFDNKETPTIDSFTIEGKEGTFGYVMEDFKKAKSYANKNPQLFIYTLISGEDDNKMYIIDGWHIVNRLGYLFGRNKAENVNIEY